MEPSLEHLWLELEGKNKHSNILLCVVYQPNFDTSGKESWLSKMDNILSQVTSVWSGPIILTGDMNIDLLKESNTKNQYLDLLNSYNLTQHVTKPTRQNSLIDHMITNIPRKVTISDVLQTPEISDHDACYICVNVRVSRYKPRFKYIRNLRSFDMNKCIKEFTELPFSIVHGVECPDEKLDILNSLILECIERHAPTKKIKVTRPPTPWLQNLDMINLQNCKKELRYLAHKTKSDQDWQNYRNIRNKIKSEIKSTKKTFYKTALSSKKPSEVWRCINKIFHPNSNHINADPNVLNSDFNSTA